LKTATNKIAASLFTLLGVAPLLFIIITSVKQQEIRHSMNRQLENQKLHTITLSKKDVHWLREGKEILISGRMFDVKSFQSVGDDTINFTGLFDDDETALVNKIKENHQSENKAGEKLLAQLFQLLQSSFSDSPSDVFIPCLNKDRFPGNEQQLATPFNIVFSPPPQV
jgi:hypothetical protein